MYKGPNFKAQHENEEVLTFYRKHWICISKSLMGFVHHPILQDKAYKYLEKIEVE